MTTSHFGTSRIQHDGLAQNGLNLLVKHHTRRDYLFDLFYLEVGNGDFFVSHGLLLLICVHQV